MKQPSRYPAVVSVIVFLALLSSGFLWLQQTQQRWQTEHQLLLKQIVITEATAIGSRLQRSLIATDVLAMQLQRTHGKFAEFERQAKELIDSIGGISNLQLAPDGIVQKIYPLAGNEAAIGHNILRDDRRRNEAMRAIQQQKLIIAGPFQLVQGGTAIIGRKPVFLNKNFWGFTSALIFVDDLIRASNLPQLEQQGYNYTLSYKERSYNNSERTFATSTSELDASYAEADIPLAEKEWTLRISRGDAVAPFSNTSAYLLLVLTATVLSILLYRQLLIPLRMQTLLNKSTEELEYQRSFLQVVLDNIKDGIVACDSQGKLSFFNEACQRLHGKGVDDVYPKDWAKNYDLYHADGTTPMQPQEVPLYRAFKGEEITDVELVIQPQQGLPRKLIANGQALLDDNDNKLGAVISMHDITDLQTSQQHQQRKNAILQKVIDGHSLSDLLHMVVYDVEASIEYARCSILLADHKQNVLTAIAAPNLPDFYNEAVDNLPIEDELGSCATAAYRKERIIVADVSTHPYWKDASELAAQADIGSCWSQPILTSEGELLGTFAIYHRHPKVPTPDDIRYIEDAATLSALVIERQQGAQQLRKLGLAVEQNPNAVLITDRDGIIEYTNPQFTEITGYSNQEILGQSPSILNSGESDPSIYQDLWGTLLNGQSWRGELHNRRKDGECYWALNYISPILDDNGEASHFVAIQEDVTEIRRINEVVSRQASHDQLTGLLNRAGFEQQLENLIRSAKRNRSQNIMLYVDIDRFKAINDSCGHVAGDELLRQFSQLLIDSLPATESVARMGIDEFAVLLEHCPARKGRDYAEKLIIELRKFSFHWQQQQFQITASLGLLIIDYAAPDVASAMLKVETACNIAKDQGENRFHLFQAEDEQRSQEQKSELNWVSEIRSALASDRFELFIQKIEPLQQDTKPHYEILLRMRLDDGSLVPPGAFLPIAERFKLAAQIDLWVFDNCMHWLNDHPLAWSLFDVLAINLSGQSLGDQALQTHICNKLSELSFPASQLKFEVTETAAIANLSQAVSFIETLREQGCKFALDDFGSGLSSFAYLKNLPVDTLKIDGMFVRDMHTDSVNKAMVRSIHEVGHIMGMQTIAEFVENDEIRQQLTAMGVDFGQGYGIAKPIPIDDILVQLSEQSTD